MTNLYVHSPSSSECECTMYECNLKTIDFKIPRRYCYKIGRDYLVKSSVIHTSLCVYKNKFKQRWSTFFYSTNINKTNNHLSHLILLNTKQTTTYCVWKSYPCWGQEQICGGVKSINVYTSSPITFVAKKGALDS